MKCLTGVLLSASLAACRYPTDKEVQEHIVLTFKLKEGQLDCRQVKTDMDGVRICMEPTSGRSFVCRVGKDLFNDRIFGCVEI